MIVALQEIYIEYVQAELSRLVNFKGLQTEQAESVQRL